MRIFILFSLVLFLYACSQVELTSDAELFLENFETECQCEITVSSGFQGRIGLEDLEIVILELSGNAAFNEESESFLEELASGLSENFYPLIANKNKFNRVKVIFRFDHGRKEFMFEV